MEHIRQAFADLVAPGDGRLDGNLDQAALLIAAAVDPSVVITEQLDRLDDLSNQMSASTPGEVAIALFGGAEHDPARHFGGNAGDYYDQQNSLLHRVLDRRIGIPITLSVLLIEVARRKGIELHGIGMPGHFLVRSEDGYIDAFHRGVMLDGSGCAALFQRLAGSGAQLPPGALAVTPPAFIAKRMLFNLSSIGSTQQQRRTLRAVRSLLSAYPDATHRDHVQHAYAAAELGQYGEAATAGELAQQTMPEQVREKMQSQINEWQSRLN